MEINIFLADEGSRYETLSQASKCIRECLIVSNLNDDAKISSESILFLLDLLNQFASEMDEQYSMIRGDYARK